MSVARDQLSCLPEPLTPAKGFSWSRHTRPWRSATFFIISMVSWLWSQAVLASEYTGAISCWAGATSLCSVLAQHAQLPQLLIQILHEGGHPGLDGTVVVVVQLLPLGGLGAEQGAAAQRQVLPLLIHGSCR